MKLYRYDTNIFNQIVQIFHLNNRKTTSSAKENA